MPETNVARNIPPQTQSPRELSKLATDFLRTKGFARDGRTLDEHRICLETDAVPLYRYYKKAPGN